MACATRYHVVRPYVALLLSLYMVYTLAWPRGSACLWLIGYKYIFLSAYLRALTSSAAIELRSAIAKIKWVQLLALTTTNRSETLALHREKKLSDALAGSNICCGKSAFGQPEHTPFLVCDKYNSTPSFWCAVL